MEKLTNDSKKLLYEMYFAFKNRRLNGQDRKRAMAFGGSDSLKTNLGLKDSISDINDYLFELKRAGYVTTFDADNTVYECWLTAKAVSDLESLPSDVLASAASFVTKFL